MTHLLITLGITLVSCSPSFVFSTEFIVTPGTVWAVPGSDVTLTWVIDHDAIAEEIVTLHVEGAGGGSRLVADSTFGRPSQMFVGSRVRVQTSGRRISAVIPNVTSATAGIYHISHNGAANSDAQLFIFKESGRPQVEPENKEVPAQEGTDFQIFCIWPGERYNILTLTYQWFRNNSLEMPENHHIHDEGQKLQISPVQLTDAMVSYKCQVTGTQFTKTSKPYKLIAVKSPEVLRRFPEGTVVRDVGESLHLMVEFYAFPEVLDYEWRHGSTSLVDRGRYDIRKGPLFSSLKIKTLMLTDYGKYTCTAHHPRTGQSASASFNIISPGHPGPPEALDISYANQTLDIEWKVGEKWGKTPKLELMLTSEAWGFRKMFTLESGKHNAAINMVNIGLNHSTNYTATLLVTTQHGTASASVTFTTETPPPTALPVREADVGYIYITFAVIMGFLLLVGGIVLIIKRRKFSKPTRRTFHEIHNVQEYQEKKTSLDACPVVETNNIGISSIKQNEANRKCPIAEEEPEFPDVLENNANHTKEEKVPPKKPPRTSSLVRGQTASFPPANLSTNQGIYIKDTDV